MPPKDEETTKLKKELEDLIKKVQEDQNKVADANLADACADVADAPKVRLSTKKYLKGHINKVNSVHYSGDSRHIVTGSLDGKLIIWDTWTGNKTQIILLRSSWVMTVAFSPSGNYVACGGMDNMCTVYDVNNRDSTGAAKMTRELLGYEGFLSSCRFLEDKKLVTGSGDMKLCIWDLEAGKKLIEEPGHAGDVVSISLAPDMNGFVTGSVDKTCKLWDLKDGLKCQQVFFGHEGDVNSVCFHPNGYNFCTASEDKTARLYDIRSDQVLSVMKPPATNPGLTSAGLSVSGRFLLCGADDNNVHIWDTLKAQHNGVLQGHENRITSLSVAPNGMGISTCSWDQNVRVWG